VIDKIHFKNFLSFFISGNTEISAAIDSKGMISTLEEVTPLAVAA
jgi:hypothetical protein